MVEHLQCQPEGLSHAALQLLEKQVAATQASSPGELLASARAHLDEVRQAAARNSFVNIRLAEEICDRLHSVAAHWQRLPPGSQPWLKAAMAYFSACLDDEPDLTSPIGFEDDCEILNACLQLAARSDLCLDPEDFDEY